MAVEKLPLDYPTYIAVLAEYYPEIGVSAIGGGDVYEDLQSDQELPPKEELDVKILYLLRTRIWRNIQEIRDFRKGAGVKVGSNWFHSDDPSRIQQLALTMMGQNMPADIMWKTMQGTFVQMTPELASQIFQATVASDKTIFGVAEFHRQNMVLSEDPVNYDYTTGWPMIYMESPEAEALRDYQ